MPCDELITRPRSPTVCKIFKKLRNQPYAPKWSKEEEKKTTNELIHYRDIKPVIPIIMA
jgi:hypothetical protein